jgi:hypothetical protein
MSELRRWSQEGASGEEALLLEASRGERAPSRARARTLAALGVAVGGTTVATSTAVAATNATAKGGMTLLMKIAAVSVLTGGVVAGGVAVVHSTRAKAPPTPVAVVEPRAAEPPAEAVPSVAAPTPPQNAAAPEHANHPAAPRPSSTTDVLAREVKSLETVQALVGRDPDGALRLLDRYQVQFPHGSLASEAIVLRTQAHLAKGDRAGAQALVDGYCSAHPNSPYAKRLKELVQPK